MSGSITDQGRKTFGEFFKKSRLEKGLNSLDATAKWLTNEIKERKGSTIKVSSDTVRRIEDGHWKEGFAFNSLMVILAVELLRYPDGKPMDFHDVMEILCENLDPFTGKQISQKARSRS